MARILNEILKFSILQVLYLYNYSIKVMKKITIAIDGFSSCGKSTMAKDLAREIGYIYIDSGAMYRAVTCLLYTSPSPRDISGSRMPSSA